jgi:hypothetical protein
MAAMLLWIAYKVGVENQSMYARPGAIAKWTITLVLASILLLTIFEALCIGAYIWATLGIFALCFWSYLSFRA